MSDINFLAELNPLKRRAYLSRFFMAQQLSKLIPKDGIIGVLGDIGKTTTVLACQSVLLERFKVLTATNQSLQKDSLGLFNGLTNAVLKVRPKTEKVILELDPQTVAEAALYLKLIKPQVLILSNLDYTDEVIAPKLHMVENLPNNGALILNWEDPLVQQLGSKSPAQAIYYGQNSSKCHIWAGNIRFEGYRTTFELNSGVERVEVKTSLLGYHQISCLLAAATIGSYYNIPLTTIKRGLERVEVLAHRMEALSGFNGSVIIDDIYGNSLIGIEAAIETINALPAKRRIMVLGEIRGLEAASEKYYRQIAQKIYNNKLDMVITGQGENGQLIEELISLGFNKERIFSSFSNPQIVNHLLTIVSRGDVVLFKGSKELKIDEVIKRVSLNK